MLPRPSFVAGVLVLIYLCTFILFAVLRIITGVSIQRVGTSGLRRISFSPRNGLRIDVRGLGLSLHRPTFAQPTWISVVITELKITLDLRAFGSDPPKRHGWTHWRSGSQVSAKSDLGEQDNGEDDLLSPGGLDEEEQRSKTWERLTALKNRVKRMHRKIHWIRMVDLVAKSTSVVLTDVGTIQVATFTVAVDTRRKTVDRSRLFQHQRSKSTDQRPAEWIISVRSILFIPEGLESTELLDYCTINIHGFLYQKLDGLRDASISIKLGRLRIPYDDLLECMVRIQKRKRRSRSRRPTGASSKSSVDLKALSSGMAASQEDLLQTVSDSKEFASSILRGIQEIQFAVSSFGLSQRIRAVKPSGLPVYMNTSMKEVSLDVMRLDQRSPAHLTYFSRDDVAHQALLTAISISVGIDDGEEHPERLLYIPMATATFKSTLPSKTIQFSRETTTDRNTNILFGNLVVTSPSVDLDPNHLPLVLAILRRSQSRQHSSPLTKSRRNLLSHLLPKASVKIAIHEPVVRVSLPPVEPDENRTDEFDLLISAMASMSLDIESSHSSGGGLHYSLGSTFRISSHQLYYQTAAGQTHNLLLTDTAEFRLQLSASPEVQVAITSKFQTFSVFMVRPEISEGVRQIVSQVRKGMRKRRKAHHTSSNTSFIRRLPDWLRSVHLEGIDFNIEIAGVDVDVSEEPRGAALHMGSWNVDYKANKDEEVGAPSRLTRRRAGSRTMSREEHLLGQAPPPTSPKPKVKYANDGRRLTMHSQSLEGFIIDSNDNVDQPPFISLPRFELAFSATSDSEGPMFHINSYAHTLYLHYSLYRHYALGVAMQVCQKSFLHHNDSAPDRIIPESPGVGTPSDQDIPEIIFPNSVQNEITTIDFRAMFVQIKVNMAADPPLMMQMHNVDAGKHRWSAPFMKGRLVRLYAESPTVKKVWARIVSIKNLRTDMRKTRRKHGASVVDVQSFDIASDAIRFAVPHQLVLHNIFDGLTNVAKTVQQLHHRFKTESNKYILEKGPEEAKKVPKVSFRSQAALFEIEDDAFEWKLGVVYRNGLIEQRQRMAREEAYRLKAKKLEELDRKKPMPDARLRANSAHNLRGRNETRYPKIHVRRSKSIDHSKNGAQPHVERGRKMRYDASGGADLTSKSQTTVEEAWENLQILNAQSWKKRIDHALKYQNQTMNDLRSIFWGMDEMPEDFLHTERILAIPQRPALVAILVSDLNFSVDKPSFPIEKCADYLHRVGKGMPHDMQYSLLIPMGVQISMGEFRASLRDYPLPLLHVPAIRPGQSPRLPSLSLKTDFVIAEEYRDHESSRQADVVVVPPENLPSGKRTSGFSVKVRRTVAPVKTYSEMKIDINTSDATRITWGASYQPAIQDMMQVVENFTKPAIDPSERVGFWDKIRLVYHSSAIVSWKYGDIHLALKGSRDPYLLTGHGAGFMMCWSKNVRWGIARNDDPRKFMTVDSDEYLLAIPDFSRYVQPPSGIQVRSQLLGPGHKSDVLFKKTCMKLFGKVQWLAGLVFERTVEEGQRSFDFEPHYKVVLRNPIYAKSIDGKRYDAFRGFRSDHIHLSMAISAPVDRNWSASNLAPSDNYNSVHLTPRFFSHFFSWWSTFSAAMSIPIRQGLIWPGIEKSTKKFGRHLGTIKYSLLLSPVYISHIYKHPDHNSSGEDITRATGLKLRLHSFVMDVHQRREELKALVQGLHKQQKVTGMKVNEALLDFTSADVRAISATIAGFTSEDLHDSREVLRSFPTDEAINMSNFTIPDQDPSWIDMDDFVELDWIVPMVKYPEAKILPLAFSPRFTYFRQTDHEASKAEQRTRTSYFGGEPTHFCVISGKNDPRSVQIELIQDRLSKIKEQISQNEKAIHDLEYRVMRDLATDLKDRLNVLRNHDEVLRRKQEFLRSMMHILISKVENDEPAIVPDFVVDEWFFDAKEQFDPNDPLVAGMDAAPLQDYANDFNNRFIVHNMQLKWSNALRNIILRYIHEGSQRRGFVYYMSRRAVKFILDIVEEQTRSRHNRTSPPTRDPSAGPSPLSPQSDADLSVLDRVRELIDDDKKSVNADDPAGRNTSRKQSTSMEAQDDEHLAEDFTAQNTYHVRLIAPQIQLQSDKNPKSAVLVTAKGMQLKVIQIMDKDRVADDISGLVQRRFGATMDSLQIYVTSSKKFPTEHLHMYSANRYGAAVGSSWPPWVPVEVMFDFTAQPFGFSRVIHRTSASMRYDKYNDLRLKYNDHVSDHEAKEGSVDAHDIACRTDQVWVEFPHVRAICNSAQYYAVYIIVMDLLMYTEPLQKTRSERLEKIMLASDFSDLSGTPELVIMLQERIRQLQEIKLQFQINEKNLDLKGWQDRISLEQDLAICEDELFFMMKAITTSQRKQDDRTQNSQPNSVLKTFLGAAEITWHLMRDQNESLAELSLKNAFYDRTDNTDGSNDNRMEIESINGLNLLPDAYYPEMISPYLEGHKQNAEVKDAKMLCVHWFLLEAIAGIPVLDRFEVNMFPLKLQLEREIAKLLFEYVFPGVGSNAFESGNFSLSPLMARQLQPADADDEDSADEADAKPRLATIPDEDSQHPHNAAANMAELRLHPTLTVADIQRPHQRPTSTKQRYRHHFDQLKIFHNDHRPQLSPNRSPSAIRTESTETISASTASRPSSTKSGVSGANGRDNSTKSSSRTLRKERDSSRKSSRSKDSPTDDLTQMLSRASNYMTLSHVKIPSVVLCLSYKGKGQHNVEDVHNLVFRMPTLEYRNKTWSNLDLALQLKKDAIRALISHTGAIIGNKFSHHRPSKQHRSHLRELAKHSTSLMNNNSPDTGSDSNVSLMEYNSSADHTPSEPRLSFASGRASAVSISSSTYSGSGLANQHDLTAHTSGPSTMPPPPSIKVTPDMPQHSFSSTLGQRLASINNSSKVSTETRESEESSVRQKSKLLFGKKFLHSLPRSDKS